MCAPCIRESRTANRTTARQAPRRSMPPLTGIGDGHDDNGGHGVTVNVPTQCGARRKGKVCTQPAGFGTDHLGFGYCKFHGGCTPTQRIGAAKQEATAHAMRFGAPLDIGPMEALLWCVRIAAGEVAYFTMQVMLLERIDVQGPTVTTKQRPRKGEYGMEEHGDTVEEIERGTPALNIWIQARQGALDRLARFTKLALDANVAEREVNMAEQYGAQLGRIVGRILDALRLTPAQLKNAPDIVRREMAVIETEGRDTT